MSGEVHELTDELVKTVLAGDFVSFARSLTIPGAAGPVLFADAMAPFQRECFDLLAPSLKAVREGTMPPLRRFWIERTKKAGKDSDLAVCLLWLMAFPVRPILVQVSAANQQQAGIIKRRAADLLFYNPWLRERVSIQQNKIKGCGGLGEVVIEATGKSGAKQGDTPDLLILNELVHVEKWDVNQTHMNNAAGVPQGVVIISTNAGIRGSKAEGWKKAAVNDPQRWTVKEWKGLAPWLSRDDEEEARKLDPIGSEHKRLWKGEWVSGTSSAVSDEAIDRCFVHKWPCCGPEPGFSYIGGLDLGVSHDHAGVAVVGINPKENRMRVAYVKAWAPSKLVTNDKGNSEVDLELVSLESQKLTKQFGIVWFGYDPAAGGSLMAQQLRRKGVPMVEMSFSSPKNLDDMARAFATVMNDGKLECYEDREGRLRRDFGKFQFETRLLKGSRLTAVSDEWGHADVGTALVICLPRAMSMLGYVGFREDDVIASAGDDEPLTDEEVKEMPDELREIYEGSKEDEDLWAGRGRGRSGW